MHTFNNYFLPFSILNTLGIFAAWLENRTFIPTNVDLNWNIFKLTDLGIKVDASHSQLAFNWRERKRRLVPKIEAVLS